MSDSLVYKRIENEISARIKSGVYRVGDRLPTERELSEEFSTSRLTVARGLSALIASGMIERMRGRGSFVKGFQAGAGAGRSDAGRPGLRGGVFNFISPSPGEHEAPLKPGVLEGMHAAANVTDYSVGVDFFNDVESELRYLGNFTRPVNAGFVIWPVQDERVPKELEKLRRAGFPFVLVDSYFHDFSCDYVIGNNALAAEMMIDHLYRLGHRRIACLSIQPDRQIIAELLGGTFNALSRRGLRCEENVGFVRVPNQVNTQRHAAREHEAIGGWLAAQLDRVEAPTAVFCSNDSLALSVIEILQQMGLRVPQDISVAGVDNIEQAALAPVPLTSVAQNWFDMGFWAVKILLSRIQGAVVSEVLPQQHRLAPSLVIRQSTGPVRG